MASSLDQAGPMAKTVEDSAILLKYMAGHDRYDSTSSEKEAPDYSKELRITNYELRNMRIGVPKEFFGQGMDEDVERIVKEGIGQLEKMGAKIVPVSLPMSKYALAVYYILMPAEVSSNLARYDGIRYGLSTIKSSKTARQQDSKTVREGADQLTSCLADKLSILDVYLKSRAEGFGAEAKRRIMLGSYVLSAGYYDAYYKKAQKVRTLIKRDFERVFKEVDILATPVSPTPAFKFGEKAANPLAMYMSDIMTVPVNPAGLPALSLPAGFVNRDDRDLPVGMQLIGPMWGEQTLLNVGHVFQLETEWHSRKPVSI